MMIIDPVTLGDVSCTRASVKYVFDRTGTLVQVPANTLAVTYDPSDLTKAPYALVEAAATNECTGSDSLTTGWFANTGTQVSAAYADIKGGTTASRWTFGIAGDGKFSRIALSAASTTYTCSVFVRLVSGAGSFFFGLESPAQYVVIDASTMTVSSTVGGAIVNIFNCWNGWHRISVTYTSVASGLNTIVLYGQRPASLVADFCCFQNEPGAKASSYYPSDGSYGTRAADVISPGAGLVFSNVAITETPYNSTSTYAKDAQVYDPATYLMYQSLIDANTGKALSDTTSWTPLLKVVNRWLMFDQYNNTQTSNAEEIVIVLSPQSISQGVYLGNTGASEVRLSVVDLNTGLAYQEVQNLIVSNSASSFWNWSFRPIKRKSYTVSVQLPPYANALVTIAIKAPGGTAKCGMCVVGPVVDVGLSQYGLSREIKDYSTVNFNTDGTSNVVKRNYAKVMDIDVIISNDQIDSVIERLEGYRQRPLAWIGAVQYGFACMFGPYVSFKSVIPYPTESTMNLQIQATV